MEIDNREVSESAPTYIIAEAASNHDGSLKQAKELVDVAADSGADAVKFQTFRAESMYTPDETNEDIYETIAEAEMPYDWIPELAEYCESNDIHFMSSPFDEESVDKLDPYVPAYKIASSVLSHLPLLEYVAEKGKPIIASTGAHEKSEVEEAVSVLKDAGTEDIVLLHCVSAYPTPLEEINVRAIRSLEESFDVPVGFSDHTLDPTIAPASAVSHGASVIEKHFTIDSSLEGMDHSHSLEPDELAKMVEVIRDTKRAQGDGDIGIQDVERDWHENAKRTVQTVRQIDRGETISQNDIDILRSGDNERGIEPKFYNQIIGTTATEKIGAGEGIHWATIDINPEDVQ